MIYTSKKRLIGKTPGQITSSGTVPGLGKKGTVWYEIGQTPDGWVYSTDKGYVIPTPPEPVDPPVVTPPPPPVTTGVRTALVGGEVFLANEAMTVGFNKGGGLGTVGKAPGGYATDTATGLFRVGLYCPPCDDIILQGRPVEGFGVTVGAVRFANMPLTNRAPGVGVMPGVHVDPLSWQGNGAGLQVAQLATLDGRTLTLTVILTNKTAAIVDATYHRAFDPDQSSDNPGGTRNFDTTQRVGYGGVECDLYGGGTLSLFCDHPDAYVATAAYNTAYVIGTRRALGYTRTADEVPQVVVPLAIAPGANETLVFRYQVG